MPREFKTTEDILAAGEEKKLITIRDGRITYEGTKEKKTYQFTDPEEPVRARVYVELIEKYKYPASRIDTEVYPPSRAPPYPADVVVYEDDEHEKVFIVVETKATSSGNEIETGKKEGLGNANLLGAKYLFVVCGEEEMAYDVEENPSLQTLESKRVPQIPVAYGKLPKYRYKKGGGVFFDLKEASLNELHNKFQRCHDEIWEGGKRDPAVSFDEMSKLMFAKIHDERFTREGEFYKFQIGTNETDFEVARRVKEIYGRAQRGEPGVFRELIELSDERIYKIIEILQDISLSKTDLDAKGRAFEKFLDRYFRGSAGQYFTPRQIVDFMVEMLEPDAEDYIMDPACGSGGFLLYSLKKVREEYGRESEAARDFAIRHIYGIEINDRIARIAMMDMVIHHDGHTNITCADALQAYDTFGRHEIQPKKYDLVFTNPPFGAVAKEEKILKIYELGSKYTKRKAQKTEILFIERCLDFLRPGGKMGIVLPDGILTNSSLQYVRDFIDKRARILAVISLPQQTFVPSGSGVKASLVFLQKKREGEEMGDYPIFMAIAEHVGYDATGRSDENDFPKILEDWEGFKEGERNFSNSPIAFVVRKSELEGRLDAFYYGTKKQIKEYSISTKYLKEVADINPKRNISIKNENSLVPYIGLPETDENLGEITEIKYRPYKEIKGRNVINNGDILFARIEPSIYNRKIIFVEELKDDFALTSTEFYIIKANEEINKKFLYYMLRSNFVYKQIFGKVTGTTGRRRLDINSFKNFIIPFPPRPIQDRIAEIMEEAYKQRKEKLKVSKDLLAGINDFVLDKLGIEIPEVEEKKSFVVNWSSLEGRHDPRFYQPRYMAVIEELNKQPGVKTIGEISKYVGSGSTPKAKGDAYTTKEEGIPFIRITNIRDDRIDLTDVIYIKREIHEGILRRTRLKPNDVLLSMAGTIGVSTVVPENFSEANINQALAKIVLKEGINPHFVTIILNTKIGRLQTERLSRPAVQANINLPEIKSIKVPVPPIEIQEEIVIEVQRRRRLAKRLGQEANEILEEAKKCVEWIILGGEEKTRETIRLIADKLKESHNPEKIILFGSYAWGLSDEDSDIDLLVIKETNEKPHDRIVNAARIISPLRRGYAVDIFVITSQELKSRLDSGDQFLQEIISRGEVLYG